MTEFSLSLEWPVHAEGYRWQKSGPGRQGDDLCGQGQALRNYRPLEVDGLFRMFADLDPALDREQLLEFANRFGTLGVSAAPKPTMPAASTSKDTAAGSETYSSWRHAIWLMRQAVDLADAASENDADLLSHRIAWDIRDGQPVAVYQWAQSTGNEEEDIVCHLADLLKVGHDEVVPSKPGKGISSKNVAPGDDRAVAWAFLSRMIERNLQRPEIQISPDPRASRVVGSLVPASLLDAMWFQLFQAIRNGSSFRKCKECNRWFKLARRKTRLPRLFCTPACRTRYHRERQDQAIQLHAEGRPIKQIARELGSDVAVVKKWISGRT